MSRFMKVTLVALTAWAIALATPLAAQRGQQTPGAPLPGAAPAGDVLGVGTFIHLVSDLNKSLAFYGELLGAMPNGQPGPRAFAPNEVVANLYGAPGAQLRAGTVRIPGTELGGAELVDWSGVERSPARPRLQDPGATTLILTVRAIEPLVAAVSRNGGAIVTPGGVRPILSGSNGKGRAILVTDPDGFFIQLVQPDPLPETDAPASASVVGAALAITVKNAEGALRFFHDALGFEAGIPAVLQSLHPEVSLFSSFFAGASPGTTGTTVRKVIFARVPGTAVPIAFVEFDGPGSNTFQPTIRDPGAGMLRLRVKDMETIVGKLKAAGATVSSANGQPVTFANGQKMVVVQDTNNFFVQPVQAAPPAPQPQQ